MPSRGKIPDTARTSKFELTLIGASKDCGRLSRECLANLRRVVERLRISKVSFGGHREGVLIGQWKNRDDS